MIHLAPRVSTDNIALVLSATIPTPAERQSAIRTALPATPAAPFPSAALVRLGDEIAELAAHIHAATYRLLVLIREFDQRGGWHTGFKTCAHWLSWRTGIAMGPAREKVRVARALEDLPALSEMMQSGELSYSKARALTRVATSENELELMEFARHGTASHVEELVRAWRRVDRLEDQWQERARHRTRELTVFPDEDGMYVIRGRLDPEVGALLTRALDAARDALYPRSPKCHDPDASQRRATVREEPTTAPQRRADAIGLLAERALQSDLEGDGASIGRADRFQVVVHVEAEALAKSPGLPESPESSNFVESMLENSVRVPAGTSQRIACDASRVIMTHGSDGLVLNVGRKTRTVPPALRRALDHRDGGCRFPGCDLRFCDAHHIKHWAGGGETRFDNLVLLCRRHHRAVHEEGFTVEIVGSGDPGVNKRSDGTNVRFHWPDGRPFPEVPPAPKLPDDPVRALEAENGRLGLSVGPETTTPHWNGERFDVGWAIHTLWRP